MGECWSRVRDYKPKHYALVWVQLVFDGGMATRYTSHLLTAEWIYYETLPPQSQAQLWWLCSCL